MSALKKEVFLQNLPEVDFREKGLFSVGSAMNKKHALMIVPCILHPEPCLCL